MTFAGRERVQELFEKALELPLEKRASFLTEACGDDAGLLAEVESLLDHDAKAGSDFMRPPEQGHAPPMTDSPNDPDATRQAPPSAGAPPETIERYEITRELHRGGQGVVYQAIQKSTKRKVALKVMLEGPFASERSKRRFEREIELVASLHHPNIVPVFDSGVSHGKYWYAMDYIRGRPLDAYVAGKEMAIEDTLRLFGKVCEAVTYAHQRGVIHRDLKPVNILVDEQGEPHVLDFGLAKVAGADAVGDSRPMLVSLTGQVIGTLPYMSPEQAKGDPNLIDIRTDVYSLGVSLYELLTGKYPYEVVGQMADVLKNIAEAEPRKPSTIRRQINDEVETIVLKALAKEPDRRYQSARHIAEDVRRFLEGEPIDAKRDSALYVLKKQLKRYKKPAAMAAILVLLILGWGVTMSVLAERERQARELAEERAEEIRRLADSESQARKEATTRAEENRRLAEKERQARELAEAFANEVEQLYLVSQLLDKAVNDVDRWGRVENELLRRGPAELTPANNARIAVRRAIIQFRIEHPSEAVECLSGALATWHQAWDDHQFADLITLETATLTMRALVESDGIAIGNNARELIEHVVKAWRAIDAKYPNDYDRFGILIAGEALAILGDDQAAESLLWEAERHLSETNRYPEWHARSLEALARLLDRTGRQAKALELSRRQQQLRSGIERESEAAPATIARRAAADGEQQIAEGRPARAIEALRQSLDAWHSAWDTRGVADLVTLRSVTDSALTIATGVPEAEKQEVLDLIQLVVQAWIGLQSKYPADYSHLGLISLGEALMALGENTEARRLLEESEHVLHASSRYRDWHYRNVELLADVTARIGDRREAAAWAEKLRSMAPPNKKQP